MVKKKDGKGVWEEWGQVGRGSEGGTVELLEGKR